MLRIGITGGIGSGKSVVCRIFQTVGIPVYFADERAKTIVDHDLRVIEEVQKIFGSNIYGESGLDREKMARIVFTDKEYLKQLNEIIHPAVGRDFGAWCEAHSMHPYVIKEAAILFESGAYREMDEVITIAAPKERRIPRVMKRDNVTSEQVQTRMNNQYDEARRQELADHVLFNDGTNMIIPQVLAFHMEFSRSTNILGD